MKKLSLLLLSVLFSISVWGQKTVSGERPAWVGGYFSDMPNSYLEVVSANGNSVEEARNEAIKQIQVLRSLATGMPVTIDGRNGAITVNGYDDLTVKARIIDTYVESIGPRDYKVSLLVQTAKNPEFVFEPVQVTNKYKFSPRVFVPGMAQFHKGQTTKGSLFIAGEVIAVSGIIAFEGLRSSYESKIKMTHNLSEVQRYINRASTMQNLRNGFIAGAVAIYLWNVIDGIVSKGKKHVEVGATAMNFSPYSDFESAGLQLTLSF